MDKSLRVLHVEDSEQDVALLTRHLSRAGYTPVSERVETAAAMRTALETQEWDVILCDYSMPHFNAVQALALLKETELDLPFIIISGTVGETVAVEAMRAGAHDYLMKDNLARLAPTIEREMQEAENRRARRRGEEEKAQLTAQIKSQRQRLNNIVASVPGVVWEAWGQPDAATQRINFVSDYVEAMLGYTVEEWVSTPNFWLTIVHPDDKARVARDAAASFASGKGSTIELRWLRKDGIPIWVESNYVVIKDDDGQSVGLRGVTTDIRERKQAEEQLRRQLDFNEAITTSLGEGVYALDKRGRVTFMNPAAEVALGWTEGELLGQQMHEVIHFQHADGTRRPKEECPLLGVLRSGHSINIENDVFTRRDGHIFPVSYTSSPIITGEQVVGAVLAFRDITERKRAEETLLQSEERYRLLFEQNPQPMWVFDLGTLSFLEVNDAAIHHYGYSREEFLAMTIKDIRPPEDIPNLLANIASVTPQHEEAGIWKHRKKDGTIIDVEVAAHELTFYGRPAQIVLAHDVTERRTLEEQFRQSQKMEAIGQLAGGIAHDFNNLLTVITGYGELTLRRLPAEDPLRPNIEEIKKAGDRAAGLTRQLLAFSRKQVLQPKVLDFNAVVSELEKMLRRLIGEDIGLRTVLESELGSVKADPGQIEQIVMNLAVNARDAMPQGGKLTIETKNVYLDEDYAKQHIAVNPGPYVMLAVSDTGTGMDEQTKAHIFEPFFTTKEAGKGTGLGLSTVYGIVKQSGGNIWVYSEAGRGTTFKIYLPRVDEGAEEYKRSAATEEAIHGVETILLTEDEEMVRKLAQQVLEMYGYQVLEAANGGAALLICERHKEPIHLLITDVIMPEMSGRELADRLAPLRPEMKVLYMSGYTDNAIVYQGVLDQGANFIQKPFPTDALARKVREVLDAPKEILRQNISYD